MILRRYFLGLALTLSGLSLAHADTPAAAPPQVKFTTNLGEFVVELYPDKAPNTVENFLGYVRDGHYNGTIFHRVINNFMIQGGGYDARYMEKPARPPIKHEGAEVKAKGGPTNTVGTIAMARTNNPHSASSQFFINVNNNDFLNHTAPSGQGWGYVAFGKVVSGMEVVNKIKLTPTGSGGPFPTDVPQTQVVIQSAASVK